MGTLFTGSLPSGDGLLIKSLAASRLDMGMEILIQTIGNDKDCNDRDGRVNSLAKELCATAYNNYYATQTIFLDKRRAA